jgi:ribosomal protein S18 acetylase RimI-like enzyme
VALTVNAELVPRSLVYATDLDVLPSDRMIARRDRHLAVRCPSNPTHHWGNLLLFDDPPRSGDRARWEQLFDAEFAGQPPTVVRTFGWDQTDGELGAAGEEFLAHGYDLERSVGMIAAAGQIRPHPRANRTVQVRSLDPRAPLQEALWDQVLELQVAGRDRERFSEESHRTFSRRRLADLRDLFAAGRGAWYVATAGDQVVGSCGVVVTDGRGRFQAVDTAPDHRRQGICSRLIVEAAQHAAAHNGARRLVIVADPDYHALGIYESVGFRAVERVCGVSQAEAA